MKRIKLCSLFLIFGLLGGAAWNAQSKGLQKAPSSQDLLNHYLTIQEKLASDSPNGVEAEAQEIARKAPLLAKSSCKPKDNLCLNAFQKIAQSSASLKGTDLTLLRKEFVKLSQALVEYKNQFKPNWPEISAFQCPMANNNQGAPWLQRGSALKNPYFGKAMESCGNAL